MGNRYIYSQDVDGDIVFLVNKGGVPTEVFRIVGAEGTTSGLGANMLETFANDAAYEVVHPSPAEGALYYNTTTDVLRIYDGSAWSDVSGGGGGLTPVVVSSGPLSAVAGNHYLCNTSGGAFTANLPAGASGSVIRFSDAARTWTQNNLTLNPASGESIDGLAADEDLICDLSGAFVQLAWDGTRWVVDAPGFAANVTQGSLSGGSGSGAKNYVTSTDNSTPWSASGAGITVTTETNLTLIPNGSTKTTGVKILRASGSDYAYLRFTLDKADYGKKFQISFDQAYGGATGDYTLAVYSNTASNYGGTSTLLPVQTSNITALTGSFVTTVDMPGSAAPYIEVRINGIAGTTALYLNAVYVGPGVLAQGAVISEWETWTPTGSWTTNTTYLGKRRRVGSNMEYDITISLTGAPSAGDLYVDLPAGDVISVASLATFGTYSKVLGVSRTYDDATAGYVGGVIYRTSSTVYITHSTAATNLGIINPTTPITFANADYITAQWSVPLSRFIGSGTTNIGPGAALEYAFNTDTSTSNNTSAFGYGPSGVAFGSYTATATAKRVRFQYPIQSDDVLLLQIQEASGSPWIQVSGVNLTVDLCELVYFDTTRYGMGISRVAGSSTDVDVIFGQYARPSGATYGGAGTAWSSVAAAARWRLVKAKASSPVGFGAATQTELGLVSLNQVKSDELNAVVYHSDARGWTATGAGMTVATTITSTELPLSGIINSGIKIVNVSGTSDEVRYDFTLPASLRQRKLKIQWEQLIEAAYGANDTTVDLKSYTDSGRTTSEITYNLSSDNTSGITYVPAFNGRFLCSFDADDRQYYRLVIKRAAGTKYVVLSNVIVGPGQITQTPAVSEWQSYTPTLVGFTGTINTAAWKRDGSDMLITFQATLNAAASGNVQVPIPSGYSLNTTAMAFGMMCGTAWAFDLSPSTGWHSGIAIVGNSISSPQIAFRGDDGSDIWNATVPFTWASGDVLSFNVRLPIAEWAGNGTVNIGAGAQVEFAFNSSATATTDTTSFGYGPQGVLFQGYAPGGTSVVTKAVQWQYPIQADDVITLEVDGGSSGSRWVPAAQVTGFPFHTNDAATAYYGTSLSNNSSTVTWVNFYSAKTAIAGDTWASLNSANWRWRVRKSKASSPVGFSAATQDTLGLVKLSQITSGKNYITSQSSAVSWNAVGDLEVSTTTTASELPRENTTRSGIKIIADADVQSMADYVYFDFTLDDVDLNRKLLIKWSQKTTGSYAAGNLAVVITTQADRTTALHTPITTAIPAADGDFVSSFDAGSTATLSLVIRATTDMTTSAGIVISDVEVGPGLPSQGAAVGEWQEYTSPVTQGFGTVTSTLRYRRIGSQLEIQGNLTLGTLPATTQARLNLPQNLTVLTTSGSAIINVGNWISNAVAGSSIKSGVIIASNGNQYLQFSVGDYTSAINPTTPQNSDAFTLTGRILYIQATVAVSEWAGNGTVNLGQGAQVEYAWNSSATTSADTTSFGYGPQGVAFQAFVPAGTASIGKRARFQYPIQADDVISVEVDNGTGGIRWVPLVERIAGFSANDAGTTYYGFQFSIVNSTDVDVNFFSAPYVGSSWGSISSWRWRVRKARPSSPVGFGLAGVDGSAGLYRAGQAPGLITGATIASGYIGEKLEVKVTTTTNYPTSGQYGDLGSIVITPGVWIVNYLVITNINLATITQVVAGVGTASGNNSAGLVAGDNTGSTLPPSSASDVSISVPGLYYNVTSNTTLYGKVYAVYSAGNPQYRGRLTAVRIA